MERNPLSLTHLVRRPAVESVDRPPLLLLLHGVGSHEGDLYQLASYLDPRFFVVSARAPITLSPGSYAWFHVQFTRQGSVIVPEEAENSRQLLLRFIDELVETYQLDPHRVYVVGFSQGAILGLSMALTAPHKLAGLVAMSGRILPQVLPLKAADEDLKGLPVLVVHGVDDAVLPVSNGRESRDILSGLPVDLTYHEYPMGHQISSESLADIAAWLTGHLDNEEGGSANHV